MLPTTLYKNLKNPLIKKSSTLPKTNSSPLKIGRNPQRKDRLQTINFAGAFAVSFREGIWGFILFWKIPISLAEIWGRDSPKDSKASILGVVTTEVRIRSWWNFHQLPGLVVETNQLKYARLSLNGSVFSLTPRVWGWKIHPQNLCSTTYTSENSIWFTWKRLPRKEFWKPSFSGSRLNFGGVVVVRSKKLLSYFKLKWSHRWDFALQIYHPWNFFIINSINQHHQLRILLKKGSTVIWSFHSLKNDLFWDIFEMFFWVAKFINYQQYSHKSSRCLSHPFEKCQSN